MIAHARRFDPKAVLAAHASRLELAHSQAHGSQVVPGVEGMSKVRLDEIDGGQWLVRSRDTAHLIDLDAHFIWRVPGPDSRPSYGLGTGVIYAFELCFVGQRAMWRVYGGRRPDFHSVHTSPVLSIEPVHPDDFAVGNDDST